MPLCTTENETSTGRLTLSHIGECVVVNFRAVRRPARRLEWPQDLHPWEIKSGRRLRSATCASSEDGRVPRFCP